MRIIAMPLIYVLRVACGILFVTTIVTVLTLHNLEHWRRS